MLGVLLLCAFVPGAFDLVLIVPAWSETATGKKFQVSAKRELSPGKEKEGKEGKKRKRRGGSEEIEGIE